METSISTVSENVQRPQKKVNKYAVNMDEALTIAGVGFFNLKYCVVLSIFLIAVVVESKGHSFVLPAAKCDLNMTDAERGLIASIPYIGIILISFPTGYLADTLGRKKVIIWSSVICGAFASVAAFMPEVLSYAVCKLISSLCMSGPAAIPFAFIGEIVPPKHKDLIMSVVNSLQITGSALVPLFAWAVIPLEFRIDFGIFEFRSWRALTIIYGAFFLIAAFFMSFGPESPKYLMIKGKHDEALKVLQTIYAGNNKGKSPDDYPVKIIKLTEKKQDSGLTFLQSLKAQSVPLLKPPYLKWIALNSVLLFGLFFTLNGLYLWVPDILNRVFSGDTRGVTVCQVIEQKLNETVEAGICDDSISHATFLINSITSTVFAVISIVASSTIKIVGKKLFLIIFFTITGVFCAAANDVTEDIIFIIFLSSMPLLGLNIGPVQAYAVETFPTKFRGMAVALSMMVGRMGSIAGINVAVLLLNLSCPATFYTFGGSLIVCALLSILLPRAKSKQKDMIKDITRL